MPELSFLGEADMNLDDDVSYTNGYRGLGKYARRSHQPLDKYLLKTLCGADTA